MRTRTASLGATAAFALAVATPVSADSYRFSVVAKNLDRPVGIAVDGSEVVYFTEVPEPGTGGGANGVSSLDLDTGVVTRLHSGEPEPTHIAIDRDGDLYWTCKSAGVVLRLAEGAVAPFATGLEEPSGIAIDRRGAVYITEIPDPGVAGAGNRVSVIRGNDKIVLSSGEPEPTDVAVAKNGDLYWTCKTAGVILRRSDGKINVFRDKLDHPSGIAIDHKGETLYFTEVPTPGVPGDQGGRNHVRAIDLRTGALRTIHAGDPEPTDVAVARNGNLYWTCTSAGVIVEAKRRGGRGDRY
jgi:glucose/arabinose dehydrogenase